MKLRWRSSLRGQVAALAAVTALMATVVSGTLGVQALIHGLREQNRAQALASAEHAAGRLRRLCERLAFEVGDYATWDELHQRMPRPDPAWAAVNLAPGNSPGRLAQVFVLVGADGALAGRYRFAAAPATVATTADPAPSEGIVALADGATHAGVAAPGGLPLIYATQAVMHSDGSGPPSGRLLAIAYLGSEIYADLANSGYEVAVTAIGGPAPPDAREEDSVRASIVLPGRDGQSMLLTVTSASGIDHEMLLAALRAMGAGGIASALLAILLGTWIGWRWLQPLRTLAESCRLRATDPAAPIPPPSGLLEADILRQGLVAVEAAERERARQLAAVIERERTTNAVHQRFLTQLARELGDPIHAIAGAIERLHGAGGRLPPEEAASALDHVHALEERLHEALGLIDPGSAAARIDAGERDLADYLSGIVELLAPLALSRGGDLAVEAEGRSRFRADLLTPVLVNLVSNALRAKRGTQVRLSGRAAGRGSVWTVEDDSGGIEPGLAGRIADACTRGEVLPGTPGIGLGLAVVLANLRLLGGRLSLDNNPGHGASFSILLADGASSSATGVQPVIR